jgi:hypothetical protein
MDAAEKCFFCGKSDHPTAPWLIQIERRSIHMPCWLAALRSGDPAAAETAPGDAAAA